MSEAFTDVLDEQVTDTGSGGDAATDTDTTTITDTVGEFADSRSVRAEAVDDDGRDVYEDPETNSEADDVDSRKLFKKPTIDQLRYFARETPYGEAIVEKPIDDAFKHGFEVVGDNTEPEDGDGTIASFLKDDLLPYYKQAEKKSRRDGLCVLMHQIDDAASSVSEPIPPEGGEFQDFQLWTLDNLSGDLSAREAAEHTEYTDDQLYVSEGEANGGIVVVDDISSPDHGDIVGYGITPRDESTDVTQASFVHADRCHQFVWGEHVDGDLGNNLTGKHVGESSLTSVLHPLKATDIGFWAMKNILYRYSAPLHAVEPPETWGTEQWDDARENMENLSMMSDGILPPGSELSVAEGVSEFDPEPIFEVLVEAICAGTVFTKSVLEGVPTGTVSGSETDVKGYFNGVHLIRENRSEDKFHEIAEKVSTYDQSTVPRVAGSHSFGIEWGPLFKPTDVEMAEGAVSLVTAVTNGIKNYVLTPDEARSIISEEWATFDIDVDLDELSEDEWDDLDRINMNEAGQGASDNEPDVRQSPMQQNGGGQPAGQTRESSQPTRDDAADLSQFDADELQAELQRRRDD